MEHKKIIKSRYNETAEHYDRRYSEIQQVKYKIIMDKITIEPQYKILDIGCGTGNFYQFLKDIKCPKFAIDFSFVSLKICKEKFFLNRL